MFKGKNFYVGRNAGKELYEDLHNAEKSIKIISPYLSPDYTKDLIGIHEKGVKVSLITSDDIETNGYSTLSHCDLIQQNRETLNHAVEERKKLLTYTYIGIGVIIFSIFLSFTLSIYGLLILTFLTIIATGITYSNYSSTRIYEYSYNSLFNLKVFYSQYSKSELKNDFLVHAKVYIIDDKIVYAGSVNFTHSGIVNSFEYIHRYDDKSDVELWNKKYENLFHDKRLHFKDLTDWGKKLYSEPIN